MPVRKIKGQCYALNVKGHRGGSKMTGQGVKIVMLMS